jgi:hypothetical protein
MKKLLLSGLLVASLLTAKAQTFTGAADNFSSVTEVGDASGGVFWFTDEEYPNSYSFTRTGSVLEIAVDKAGVISEDPKVEEYSVIGLGFGDSNGEEPGGEPIVIDISDNKLFSIVASAVPAAPEAVSINLQIEDINGVKIEIAATNKPNGEAPKFQIDATETPQTFTFDLEGARIVENWNCVDWPSDCPTINTTAQFDYTQVAKIVFLISGGKEYQGTVTFDDFKIGGGPDVLSTTAAKAAISSSKLYPNPATESASIEVSLKESSDVKVTLSDLMGREVAVIANERSLDVNKSFSTANLAKGMYTVNYFINGAPAKAELLMVK